MSALQDLQLELIERMAALEPAPGEPFYLYGESGELKLDIGVADEADSYPVLRVHKLFFDVDGREPTVGYQLRLPDDAFDHPPVELHGISIRTASPLALYQLRAAIASIGSFGPLSERQQQAMQRLRERFFPERTPVELVPELERLLG